MHIYIYSHTHWDREWYLSQTQFQYRLVRTLDEIIALLDAGDGLDNFVLDGQTCIVQDYLELRPERAGDIKRLIADGKLVIGPWYSMPDVFLADGESLIHNLLRGHADCRAYGAPYPNVGYVPDSFGHIEQMPQILRGAGIDNFVFGRGRPVALSLEAGHKLEFVWQAPDGSRVTAFHLPEAYTSARYLPGPDQPEKLRERFEHIIATFAPSHHPDLALAAHGMDHTWLQRDTATILRALPGLMPHVRFHHGSIEDFVTAWMRRLPDGMDVWTGQLRGRLRISELHGTLSSRMDNKLWNTRACRFIENLAEPLDAIAGRFGKASAACHLRKAWELICQNHAHDSICGCSQDRVHDEVNSRFLKAAEIGTDVADSALDYLNEEARRRGEPEVIVYAGLNAGHRVVEFVLRLPRRPTHGLCLAEADGTRRPVQSLQAETLRIVHTNATVNCVEVHGCAYLPDLQPGEVRRLRVAPAGGKAEPSGIPPSVVTCRDGVLDNGILRVVVRPDGTLDLTDLRTGLRVAGAHYFVQEADLGGGYHFEPLAGEARRDTRGGRAWVRRLAAGPLRGELAVGTRLAVPARYDRRRKRRVGRAVLAFTSRLTLDAGSDMVAVSTTLDNPAGNQRIRLVLPSGLRQARVHADASFAVHANAPGTWPADAGQNFHPMRSFVDISGETGGLAFLGGGQHEYEIAPQTDGTTAVEVTLLRSVDFVFLCSTWKTPGAQLRGRLTHDYALRLHPGDWRAGRVAESAAAFLAPAVASVHGDSLHSCEDQDHATIGFYARRGRVEIPVDTNRSPWHVTNAHRDGWRRIEADRFTHAAIPARIVPFTLEGEHLVVSAFKRAEDGNGEILRFWSAAATEQTVTVRGHNADAVLAGVNLLEQPVPQGPRASGSLVLHVRPFQVVTVRIVDLAGDDMESQIGLWNRGGIGGIGVKDQS